MVVNQIKETRHAKGIDIRIYTSDFQNEFISLTYIAKYKSDDPNATICNWMRNRDTLDFLGLCIMAQFARQNFKTFIMN